MSSKRKRFRASSMKSFSDANSSRLKIPMSLRLKMEMKLESHYSIKLKKQVSIQRSGMRFWHASSTLSRRVKNMTTRQICAEHLTKASQRALSTRSLQNCQRILGTVSSKEGLLANGVGGYPWVQIIKCPSRSMANQGNQNTEKFHSSTHGLPTEIL